jgi:hypothetical protein
MGTRKLISMVEAESRVTPERAKSVASLVYLALNKLTDASTVIEGPVDPQVKPDPSKEVSYALFQSQMWAARAAKLLSNGVTE